MTSPVPRERLEDGPSDKTAAPSSQAPLRRDPYATARDHAQRAFAEHEMAVLSEDGVYRHLRFQEPGTWIYGFDIVTWPGHLYVGGDIESFTFARISDMTTFFSSHAPPFDINPDYWGEKLTNHSTRTRHYTREALDRRVAEFVAEAEDPDGLRGAWDDHVFCRNVDHEYGAHEALMSFEVEGRQAFADSWEWDLAEWDHHFLLSCFAIVHGLAMWRSANDG